MTTPAPPPPTWCPDCSTPLTGVPRCPACGLSLVGPAAVRLWQVDQAIAGLRAERTDLIRLLRRPAAGGPFTAVAQTGFPAPVAPAPAKPREASERSVQNTLLALGVLLLAVSGVILVAVTYGRLGAGGRAAALLALTAAAAAATARLHRRGLTASAEAAAGVTLVLAVLDAVGLRSLGVAADLAVPTYAAVCSALLSVGCYCFARVVAVRVAVVAGLVLADAAPLLVLSDLDAPAGSAGVLLALLAVVNVSVAGLVAAEGAGFTRAAAGQGDLVGRTANDLATLLAGTAVVAGAVGAWLGDPLAPVGLLVVAGLVAAAPHGRLALGAGAVPLLAAAAWGQVHAGLPDALEPLVPALIAAAALPLTALFPAVRRPALLTGALVTVGVGFATQAQACVETVVGPFGWLTEPWSLPAGSAREVLSPQLTWSGSYVTAAVTAALAVVLFGAGRVHPGRVGGDLPAAAVGLGAV
ncbi:MAG: hypothetical protein JWL64_2188, partial [Frankiales bacterium]|nr:hypothetical protein [Frankiales bacterium]